MAISFDFEYFRPASITEAVKIYDSHDAPAYLAGGTDLVCRMDEDFEKPDAVIDLKRVPGLKGVSFNGDALEIGALTTINELADATVTRQRYPLIAEALTFFASNPVRNRATVGGNLCSAVPCTDCGTAFSVYDTRVEAVKNGSRREIPLSDFFLGSRKTALQNGEIASKIILPLPKIRHSGIYVKLGRYRGEDLAQVSVSILMLEDLTYRICFGAVAPTPVRARKIEQKLTGEKITTPLLKEVKKLVADEISPITDVRASAEYRLHMAEVMLWRGLTAVSSRFDGKGPKIGEKIV